MQAGLIVQKYGGTSVGSIERIQAVAQRVAHTVEQGKRVVVVVSAMGEETDRLVELGEQILQGSPTTPAQWREWDMLLSTGEQVSIALLALALQRLGYPALSLTAAQVGIVTTRDHGRARILHIHTDRLWQHLERGEVVVVAGFQGITSLTELEITTLGRGDRTPRRWLWQWPWEPSCVRSTPMCPGSLLPIRARCPRPGCCQRLPPTRCWS